MASPNSLNDQYSEIDTIFIEELLKRLEALAKDNEELEEFSEDAEQSTDVAAASTTTSESESESEEDPEIAALTTHHQQEGQYNSHFAEGQSPAKSHTSHSSSSPTTTSNGLSPLDLDTIDTEEIEAAYRDQRPW